MIESREEKLERARGLVKLTYTRHWAYTADANPVSTAECLAELLDDLVFDGQIGDGS